MTRVERMNIESIRNFAGKAGVLIGVAFVAGAAGAQAPSPPSEKPAETRAPDAGPLTPLAWLEGCWRGTVNKREFREQWMPLRGNLLLGVSQTVIGGTTDGYEYLRLEPRPDGIHYVVWQPGKSEVAYRLAEQRVDRTMERNDEIFGFVNPGAGFPEKITYRRGSEGWLYAAVEGKISGADRQVTYPMRRIDCESGEFIGR
jgi:hypothetical protein